MTKQEAVETIKMAIAQIEWEYPMDYAVAFDMALKALSQPEIVRCKDCKYWDKTTREEGNDCRFGPWEDAVCDMLREWDSYGELGESFRRTNGNWYCADGERRDG